MELGIGKFPNDGERVCLKLLNGLEVRTAEWLEKMKQFWVNEDEWYEVWEVLNWYKY